MARFSRLDKQKLEALIRSSPDKADKWLRGVGFQMEGDVKMGMQSSPADGQTYTRGGVTHTASSPGNPPRPDTGTLINTIRLRPKGRLHYELVAGTEYAEHLEFGTERMMARPFMTPVFVDWQGKWIADAKRNLIDV